MKLTKVKLQSLCQELALSRKTGTKPILAELIMQANENRSPEDIPSTSFPDLGDDPLHSDVQTAITTFVQDVTQSPVFELSMTMLNSLPKGDLQKIAVGLQESTSGTIEVLVARIWARFSIALENRKSAKGLAEEAGHRPPGWLRSVVACVPTAPPRKPWNKEWRAEVEASGSRFSSGELGALLTPSALQQLPKIHEEYLLTNFCTPTVSPIRPYSSTFNRSSNFLRGNCDHVSDDLFFAVEESSNSVLVHGTIKPSMAKSKTRPPHRIFLLFCYSSTSPAQLATHCTCYNGSSGNCAHIVALLRTIGIRQGTIKPLVSPYDDKLCRHLDDLRLHKALSKREDMEKE